MAPRRTSKKRSATPAPGRRRAALGLRQPKAAKARKPQKAAYAFHALIAVALITVGVIYAADFLREPSANAALYETATVPPKVDVNIPKAAPLPRPEPIPAPVLEKKASEPLPPWRRYAVAAQKGADSHPRLAIVIDDLGLDERAARQVAALPRPLTMAFLPYARNLPAQTLNARLKGHELLVHLPMEPESAHENPGRNALLVNLPQAEIERRLDWNLSQFTGFVGVNNHMGSRFTSDPEAMRPVLEMLAKRGLLYLDSRTVDTSVGDQMAASLGLPHARRNVFLDNERDVKRIIHQLDLAEAYARHNGSAIAIGHPHKETIEALRRWLPEAEARGIILAPLSSLMKTPAAKVAAR